MSLARDNQQWVFDWMIKETGRVFHFQGDGRGGLPPQVRSHDMISKHVGRHGLRLMQLAEEEEQAGHAATALEFYFEAASALGGAQHTIFENNQEKAGLHGLSLRAYERVRALNDYVIERVEVPWDGGVVAGYLHLAPGAGPAPCIIVIPGCDMTKEMYPHPFWNHAGRRGSHVFVMDGPGQGESNLAGTRLTSNNYEVAVAAVVTALQEREGIAADQIGLYGISFGTFWALRSAASIDGIAGCVGSWASIGDLRHLMNEESPRYKQLFAYLTQSGSEGELDELIDEMTLEGRMSAVTCPTLLVVGEYDPRSPLAESYATYDSIAGPKELWVLEDQHHICSVAGRPFSESSMWNHDSHAWAVDWLVDRFSNRAVRHDGEVIRLSRPGPGPNGSPTKARSWFAAVEVKS